MVALSGPADAPHCPRFSAVPRGFSDQFRIGYHMVTFIGDCFHDGLAGGAINNLVFQPKYEDDVYMPLFLADQLGEYHWVGGLACGTGRDT